MPPPGHGEPLAKSSQAMLSRKGAAKKDSETTTAVKCRYFDRPIFIALNDPSRTSQPIYPLYLKYYIGPIFYCQGLLLMFEIFLDKLTPAIDHRIYFLGKTDKRWTQLLSLFRPFSWVSFRALLNSYPSAVQLTSSSSPGFSAGTTL